MIIKAYTGEGEIFIIYKEVWQLIPNSGGSIDGVNILASNVLRKNSAIEYTENKLVLVRLQYLLKVTELVKWYFTRRVPAERVLKY